MENLQLLSPPRTMMEVFKMLPEGTRVELIEERLYMSPAPTSNHQRIIRKIAFAMSDFVESRGIGEVFFAPFDVYLDEHANAVQPDIVFIPIYKSESIERLGMHGVPDLIVEVLSHSNSKHDTVTKKALYEKFGVKEYWVVDSETKEATGYELKENVFIVLGNFIGTIQSKLLGITFVF